MSEVEYVLPESMTVETAPPVAIASMGPVALAFFVGQFNLMVAAGMPPVCALACAWDTLYTVGFWRQTDGTWRRNEKWEERMADQAKWYEPSGVMRAEVNRAGKVLSKENADKLRSVCRGMQSHMGEIVALLESCGYGMDEETPVEDSAEETEKPQAIRRTMEIVRGKETGETFWGWASVTRGDTGEVVVDSYGTYTTADELHRAVDSLAMQGRYLALNDEHGKPVAGQYVQHLVIDDEIARELAAHPNKRGLFVKAIVHDQQIRRDIVAGKRGLSIEGTAVVAG